MAQAVIQTSQPITDACASVQPADMTAVVRHLTHELRQPLSTIEAAAYYLKLTLEGENGAAERQLDRIEQMVHQINWILSDAVHFVQAAPPRRQLLDLAETVSSVLAGLVQEHGVELDWSDANHVPLVAMDPNQAQHMVRSVLEVFRQLARGEAPVAVSLRGEGELAVASFTCEVPAALCTQCTDLLRPFDERLPAGAGLGLASVKRIAEAHQGEANIFPHEGMLTLEIRLPAAV